MGARVDFIHYNTLYITWCIPWPGMSACPSGSRISHLAGRSLSCTARPNHHPLLSGKKALAFATEQSRHQSTSDEPLKVLCHAAIKDFHLLLWFHMFQGKSFQPHTLPGGFHGPLGMSKSI